MKEIIPISKRANDIEDRIDIAMAEKRKDDECVSWEDAKRELEKHYDGQALNSFRKTSEDYKSGKVKGYPVEESMDRIRKQLKEK